MLRSGGPTAARLALCPRYACTYCLSNTAARSNPVINIERLCELTIGFPAGEPTLSTRESLAGSPQRLLENSLRRRQIFSRLDEDHAVMARAHGSFGNNCKALLRDRASLRYRTYLNTVQAWASCSFGLASACPTSDDRIGACARPGSGYRGANGLQLQRPQCILQCRVVSLQIREHVPALPVDHASLGASATA